MLAWADSQLKRLKADIQTFLATKPYHIVAQHEEVTGDETLRVCVVRMPPEDFIFLIGDVVHNLRVSLDYLAFAIAEKRNPTFAESNPRDIAFPICHDFDKSWGHYSGKVRKWGGDEALTVIEGFQPHNGRNTPQSEALRLLDELENPHKHRQLLAAGSATINNALALVSGNFDVHIVHLRGGPFGKDGAEVLRFRYLSRPDPKAVMKYEAAFGIAFSKEGPARGAEVVNTLENIRDRVRDDIVPKLEELL